MLNRFKQRSTQPEFLDGPGIPSQLLEQNLRELDFLNRRLGGHAISLEGVKKLVTDKNRTWHLVDLGCGSGDVLLFMAKWGRKNGFRLQLTGVDKNSDAIDFLKRHCREYPEINGIAGDYAEVLDEFKSVDIFHCGLFCHHLKDEELMTLFCKINGLAQSGFVVNDLQRHPLAYYGAKWMASILGGSVLSKNDGPVSVLRAFKKEELVHMLQSAGVEKFVVRRRWPFRFLVVGGKDFRQENCL
jgi:2-polyprenyl-3-methyl-5-hydroxy-6-metoxy-1,4-benzoquinol methylase